MEILPALTSNKDESLQQALQRMLSSHERALQAGDDDIIPIIEKMAETLTWPVVKHNII